MVRSERNSVRTVNRLASCSCARPCMPFCQLENERSRIAKMGDFVTLIMRCVIASITLGKRADLEVRSFGPHLIRAAP